MLRTLTGVLIVSSLCIWVISNAETFEECGNDEVLYVASGLSCSHYIMCDGEDSLIGECEEDTPYFSEQDQTCDVDPRVCKVQEEDASSSSVTPSSSTSAELVSSNKPSSPALPPSSTVTSAPGMSSTISSSSATSSSASMTSTITSTTTTGSSSSATFTPSIPTSSAATNIGSQCPTVDDPLKIVFLPDVKSCADYFMCYHGDAVPMHCSNMLHFDEKSQKCDYPENVKCQLDTASPREKCQVHTVDVYPHSDNCNYYYLCRYGYLMVMQCPLNMDWDYEKKACALRGKAKCYHTPEEAITMFRF